MKKIIFILICLFGLTVFSQKTPIQKGVFIQDSLKKSNSKKNSKLTQPLQEKLDRISEIDIELTELNKAFEIQKDTISEKLEPFKTDAIVSYYADKFHGRKTASGQVFNNKKFTAAHKKLPFGTRLKITNEANGKSVEVIVNDRGPFTKGRELDISKAAFLEITRDIKHGLLRATIEIIE